MAINMFDTRVMTKALEQLYTPTTFLRDTFFGDVENHDSQYVDIDIEVGSKKVAAYVAPMHEGRKVDAKGFTTKSYKAPYTKQKMVTTAEAFLKREMGKTMYSSGDTSGSRAQKELGKNLKELSEQIDRLEEFQAAQALQQGQLIVKGEGIEDLIDFGFAASHKPVLTGTALWSDHANATPMTDLAGWVDLIADDSGLIPSKAVSTQAVMRNLVACAEVQDNLDNRRIVMGEIDPTALNKLGVRYWGYLKDPGIDLWSYDAKYYDEATSTNKPYIQDGKVIMVGDGARATLHHGAIVDLDNTAVTARFAKSWVTKDPSARWIMVQSAPMCVPHQKDAFLVATVL